MMGGKGSGGHNRVTDEEKRRRGTFRSDQSEAVHDAKAQAKVVSGPWLSNIPDPELPLSEIGRKKYFDLARTLFDANKLTAVTRMQAEQVAVLFQEQHRRLVGNLPLPASLSEKLQRALTTLKIAEDARPIKNPEAKANRFSSSGFSNRKTVA